MVRRLTENWAEKPDADDYPAAEHYLSLLMRVARAKRLVLPPENLHVARDIKKVNAGKPLSPVLLVRGQIGATEVPLTVADGYHRICASYHLDENADIPCRIVDLTSR